ncbi:GRAB protein, partial [Polypterus senegalus]
MPRLKHCSDERTPLSHDSCDPPSGMTLPLAGKQLGRWAVAPMATFGYREKKQNRRITAILGSHNLNNNEASRQEIAVSRMIPHELYDSQTNQNDIMLLQLERKVMITPEVQTIKFSTDCADIWPGMTCSVAGWGCTFISGRGSNVLREVDVTIQNICRSEQCYNLSRGTVFCAMGPGIKAACEPGSTLGFCPRDSIILSGYGKDTSSQVPCQHILATPTVSSRAEKLNSKSHDALWESGTPLCRREFAIWCLGGGWVPQYQPSPFLLIFGHPGWVE